MDATEILLQLSQYDALPEEALRAAAERREEMVPLFLAEIEDFLAADADIRLSPGPLFYIFHLLGDWRETQAYRPLARLLRCPAEDVSLQLGDAVTETAHRVMAAVCDGDPQPIFDIVLAADADEFVRSSMCDALVMLVWNGTLPGDQVARFLRDGFMNIAPQRCCFVWHGWQAAIAMLGLAELTPLVEKAFSRGFVDRQWLSFQHFEEDLRLAVERGPEAFQGGSKDLHLFGDTVEELSTWYLKPGEDGEDEPMDDGEEGYLVTLPVTNPFRDVGRNDPCPCGSGKKYKKCCLA